jgi:hypothetical protein
LADDQKASNYKMDNLAAEEEVISGAKIFSSLVNNVAQTKERTT